MDMISVRLPYGKASRTLSIQRRNLLAVINPGVAPVPEPTSVIENALDYPVGSSPLGELVAGGGTVTILIDDNTRPTPAHLLLPPLLERLSAAGIERANVTILVAGGTHRPMTGEEIRAKVGPQVQRDYRVVNHRWMDKDQLVMLERTATGVPVEVNRMVTEADFCIGIGDIAPHPLAGWSGGGKILQPGACGEATTSAVHAQMIFYPPLSAVGDVDCPPRLEIERVARKAGLHFIVNTVLDAEHNVIEVFAGDPVAAHRKGVEFARGIWSAPVPDLADIVIASSYPADIDFWQAQKTLHFMECAIKRGGDMILLTPCPEGISQEENHREMILRYARYPAKSIYAKAKAAGAWDWAGITSAVHVAMTRELADVTIVSEGLSADDCEAMGLRHAADLDEAFQAALSRHGPDATVTVLPQGPKVLPVFKGTFPRCEKHLFTQVVKLMSSPFHQDLVTTGAPQNAGSPCFPFRRS